MSNKIEVVLLQSVKGLGNKWDIVSVAIAYAKNVLVAQGKAKPADKQAISEMQQKKDKQKRELAEEAATFDAIAQWIANGGAVKIQKKATPQWHLYEKVSAREIQQAIQTAASVKLDVSWIVMSEKIEHIGETKVGVIYKSKKLTVPVTVY